MWTREEQQGDKAEGQETKSTEVAPPTTETESERKSALGPRSKGNLKVTLHWQAQRRVAGKRKIARFKHTLSVREEHAKELRRGRLTAVNDQLLEIERRELGGVPDSRTWLRTHG